MNYLTNLHLWLSCKKFTIKDLQSLLAKLSCVSACIHASRILVSCLLNTLQSFPRQAKQQPVTLEMHQDLSWRKTFLPLLNSVSVIKPMEWFFDNLCFSIDACTVRGGATCIGQCLTFAFPHFVCSAATHISTLELFNIIDAVKFWAPMSNAVTVINSGSTNDPFMQHCLRQLWFLSTFHDFELCARHPSGKHTSAGALSRWHIPLFQAQLAHLTTPDTRRLYQF